MTHGHADDLLVSAENDDFLDDNIISHLPHAHDQRMANAAVFRYEENTLSLLTDGIIWKTIETLLKIAAEDSRNGILSDIYGAAEEVSSTLLIAF